MRLALIIELAAGWLAVALGVAIALFTWMGGFIEPQSVFADLFGFGVILLLIAIGVTLDAAAPTLAARIVARVLLTAGTLLLLGVTVISFVALLFAPALLAITATLLAYTRGEPRAMARPAR
ncbi:MAG TPA: hypothetical protein VFQ25_15140 [Ktedonobacterales bacterium]|nr:hypothetical protein [Ktedonobacterales bacterium]